MATDQTQMQRPRYMGVPTFFRAPAAATAAGVDIAVIGIPFDGGVTNRSGARHGPRELRNQSSLMRTIHPVTRRNPFDDCRVADLGDVDFSRPHDILSCCDEIERAIGAVEQQGARPLVAGGDHTISYPILKALARSQPLGLIHIDAHTDTWDSFAGNKLMHGTPFRRAVEAGAIDPKRTIQIGIRGAQISTEGWDYSRDSGMRVMFMDEVVETGIANTIAEARRVAGAGPVYLSFDIDSLDPVYAPGTGTPEAGGFTAREAIQLLRGLDGLAFAGADVVEVSPPHDVNGLTALHGATVMYEALCLLAADFKA